MSTISNELLQRGGTPGTSGPVAIASRLDSVDLLRGIIMVVMSLDHLREYLTYLTFGPENLARTWPALFFTRWITHFCAPLFFFLAGTGAYLARSRGRSGSQLSHFLWTRGLWLIVMEVTILDFGWMFRPWLLAGVLYSLGVSMIVLAMLVRLPVRWIAVFGLAMIFLHNLLDAVQPRSFGRFAWVWTLLHSPGIIPVNPARGLILIPYVLIPWVGVMAAGYAFGAILSWPPERRRKTMIAIGVAAILLFVLLRASNIYGYPPAGGFPGSGKFVAQSSAMMTLVAFLNTAKYPPSLQFLLMTLGPGILALAAFDGIRASRNRLAGMGVVFGRVPFFYYVVHVYAAHLVTIAIAFAFHQPHGRILRGDFMFTKPEPGYGHGLAFLYLVWLLLNVALYFPCRWYAEYKRTHRRWWLSYL